VISNQDTDSLIFCRISKQVFLPKKFMYTRPKGDVKMLPVGATALDFALLFTVQSVSKCIGAKVNHKLVPISHKLRSGDQVEIITSNKQKPSEDWLNLWLLPKQRARSKMHWPQGGEDEVGKE
jgi:guanosine-3',5'-bis(diphosphate) 3'-pyrophosphohydrolase